MSRDDKLLVSFLILIVLMAGLGVSKTLDYFSLPDWHNFIWPCVIFYLGTLIFIAWCLSTANTLYPRSMKNKVKGEKIIAKYTQEKTIIDVSKRLT